MGKRPPPPLAFGEKTSLHCPRSPVFRASPPSTRLPHPTILPTAFLKVPASFLPSGTRDLYQNPGPTNLPEYLTFLVMVSYQAASRFAA